MYIVHVFPVRLDNMTFFPFISLKVLRVENLNCPQLVSGHNKFDSSTNNAES